jgi:hypothetical protein
MKPLGRIPRVYESNGGIQVESSESKRLFRGDLFGWVHSLRIQSVTMLPNANYFEALGEAAAEAEADEVGAAEPLPEPLPLSQPTRPTQTNNAAKANFFIRLTFRLIDPTALLARQVHPASGSRNT